MLTGGGPPPTPVDETTQKVYDLIPDQFDSLENPYDDDQFLSQSEWTDESQPDVETVEPLGNYMDLNGEKGRFRPNHVGCLML